MDHFTAAKGVVEKLTEKGFSALFAGGWVRDLLMEHPSSDIDIATNATPAEIATLFKETIPVGISFGVVIVRWKGFHFEVATFRRDIDYEDGRKPSRIEHATAEEDAKRRDFTINGMFYDPLEEKVIDFVGGAQDLKLGIIRTIGNPFDRFYEDRLRMVRAVRFTCRFQFHMDIETEQAIIENAPQLFPAVSIERISQEFSKMIEFPHFDVALLQMHHLGLLQIIFPELKQLHLHELKNLITPFSHFPKNAPLLSYLLTLFPHYTTKEIEDLGKYLKLSNKDIQFGIDLKNLETIQNPDTYTWSQLYANPEIDLQLEILQAKCPPNERQAFKQEHEERRKTLSPHIKRIRERSPLVTSSHLLELGVVPGKRLGFLLKEAEKASILHDLVDAHEIISHLRKERFLEDEER